MSDKQRHINEKLLLAYNQMMKRVKDSLKQAEKVVEPRVLQAIASAEEKAVELGELTREEASRIAKYLRRDLQDAGRYLASDEAQDIKNWLRFDIELIENTLLEMFLSVADQTKLDMLNFEEQLAEAGKYRTGEITGPGTLACTKCGEMLHFHQTGHIPPCPKCHNIDFIRQ